MKTATVAIGMAAGSSNDRKLARSRRKCQFCYSYSCFAGTGVSLSCYMLLIVKRVSCCYFSIIIRLEARLLGFNRIYIIGEYERINLTTAYPQSTGVLAVFTR